MENADEKLVVNFICPLDWAMGCPVFGQIYSHRHINIYVNINKYHIFILDHTICP